MKLIDKLNQERTGNIFWKAEKILLNRNQRNNEQLPMNKQEAADVFAEKLKSTMKINESKADNGKDHKKIVSIKTRETNFKSPMLSEEERKYIEIKTATLKSILKKHCSRT